MCVDNVEKGICDNEDDININKIFQIFNERERTVQVMRISSSMRYHTDITSSSSHRTHHHLVCYVNQRSCKSRSAPSCRPSSNRSSSHVQSLEPCQASFPPSFSLAIFFLIACSLLACRIAATILNRKTPTKTSATTPNTATTLTILNTTNTYDALRNA
jgi:hypothetical protein